MALQTTLFVSLLFSMVPLFRAVCQDDEITLSFTRSSYNVNENNGPAQPVLVLSQPVDCCSTISVWVNIEEGTAKEGEGRNFQATSPVRVLFPGGVTRVDFDVLMVDNVKLEGSKNFFVSIDPLSLPYGVVLGDHPTAEVVIMDDEEATVSFEPTEYEIEEDDGYVELTIALSQEVLIYNTSIQLRTVDLTTTQRCDHDVVEYNFTIPFNVTTFKCSIPIINDEVYEVEEKFSVVIAESYHSQIRFRANNFANVTVIDDENPISVSFSQMTFPVNEHDGNVTVELTLSRPIPCCVHLYVEVEDITATRGIDYGDNDTTQYIVTFPAGTSCSSFDIPIIDDIASEDDETFRITIVDMSLPFGTRLGDDYTAEVIIEDNDNYLNFSAGEYEIYEDEGSLCINLTLHKPAFFDTTIEVDELTGTAIGGVDYEAGPYLVDIIEGNMNAEFCINIINDSAYQTTNGAFILQINRDSLPLGIVTEDPAAAFVTILEDEYLFRFEEIIHIVGEGDKPNVTIAGVKMNFSSPLRSDTPVQFRYDNLTAYGNESGFPESEIDFLTSYSWPNFYIVKEGTVNFTLNITIIGDDRLEDNELFRIYIDQPKAPAGIVNDAIDVIISNDDDFIIGFDKPSYAVDTKNHPEIPIIKFHDFPGEFIHDTFFPCEVIISEGALDDTAVGAYADNEEDYTFQNYSFTFNSTDDEFPVIIRPVDDNIVEPDEYFTLNITLVGKRDHFEYKYRAAKITIYNDDVCTVRILEKNGRDVLYFSKELSTNVTVNIIYDDGTGNQIITEHFTGRETFTRNDYPLPNNVIEVEVFVREDFLSRLPNLVPGDRRIKINPPVE